MPKKLLEDDSYIIDSFLLNRSNLSWDEQQIIEYIRQHPEEREKLIELLKK